MATGSACSKTSSVKTLRLPLDFALFFWSWNLSQPYVPNVSLNACCLLTLAFVFALSTVHPFAQRVIGVSHCLTYMIFGSSTNISPSPSVGRLAAGSCLASRSSPLPPPVAREHHRAPLPRWKEHSRKILGDDFTVMFRDAPVSQTCAQHTRKT